MVRGGLLMIVRLLNMVMVNQAADRTAGHQLPDSFMSVVDEELHNELDAAYQERSFDFTRDPKGDACRRCGRNNSPREGL